MLWIHSPCLLLLLAIVWLVFLQLCWQLSCRRTL